MPNTNHLAEAVRLNEKSKARVERANEDGLPVPFEALVLAAQAQVHATLVLAERTHG